ncbi:MAG: hypothetical protein Ct9H300mP19_09580 [Dehalococcoidia bacterium]|nr:MAG: hypothetical protein Ct9H300mP19_09580 [Dehalococcoidia bacterium]
MNILIQNVCLVDFLKWDLIWQKILCGDVFVLNTCVVRQSAEDTATGMLGRLGKEKKNSGNQIIGVTGCMVALKNLNLNVVSSCGCLVRSSGVWTLFGTSRRSARP